MVAPTFEIRSVTSGGALDKFFPDFQTLDISPVFCEAGTISIKYPQNGINWNLLQDDLEIAILCNGVEVPELRCVIESTEGNDADNSEDGALWTYTCRTMLGRMDMAVIYPPLWPLTDPVKHTYVGSNAGKILSDFVTFAHNRGALSWLTYDFSATVDSAGNAWTSSIDMIFNVGVKYSDIVKSLVDASVVEVRVSGRTLQAYNVDTLGSDKTTGANPVRFMKGRDMKESPRKSSTRDLSTTVLLAGHNNVHVERTAGSGVLAQWGRREHYRNLSHVETAGALDAIGDALIAEIDQQLLEVTHSLFYEIDQNPQPVRDFNVGDWVLSDVGYGWERHRIKQWVVSVDNQGHVEGSVTLNDLVNEQLNKVNRRLTDMENGTVNNGPSEKVDDGRPPAIPNPITLSTTSYTEFDQTRTIVTASWSAITTNSDGTSANDIAGYTARMQYNGDGFWRATKTVDNNTNSITFDNVDPGIVVVVQVECHDRYAHSSGFSANQTITTAIDTVAPLKPASPTLSSNVGTLRVQWSGLDYQGNQQVADYAGVEVHLSSGGPSFTPSSSTLFDKLTARSACATTITPSQGLVYNTQYWCRLVAVDTTGNKSTPSDSTSNSTATLLQVVGTEVGTGQVGLSNTAFSDVGNLVDDGNFENSFIRSQRTPLMTGTHFSFDNTTRSVGTWSIRHDYYSGATGTSEGLKLQGSLPVKPGERVFGAADYRSTTDVPAGCYLDLAVKWLDNTGTVLDSTGAANPTAYYELTNQSWGTVDNTWHSRVAGISKVAPPNVATMEIWLIALNHSAGTFWVDAVEVRRQIDTLLIADAAITNAKIANLAVNDAQIANVSAGKLTVGTLTADITVSSRIKTANTGARVELSSSGLNAYNSAGTQTVAISSADGSATIIGNFKSGTTGRRVDINPSNTGLPEIRFYPTSNSNYGFLNAVDGASGTHTFVGLNSGQFTANSQTVAYRSYMTDASASLEMIRSDTQAQWGGGLYVYSNGVVASFSGSSREGYFGVWDTSSEFGFDGGSTSSQAFWRFSNNSVVDLYARFNNYLSLANNEGIQTSINWMGGAGGLILGYGATMVSYMAPGGTYYDDNGSPSNYWRVSGNSSTGYHVDISAGNYGAWIAWTYRTA